MTTKGATGRLKSQNETSDISKIGPICHRQNSLQRQMTHQARVKSSQTVARTSNVSSSATSSALKSNSHASTSSPSSIFHSSNNKCKPIISASSRSCQELSLSPTTRNRLRNCTSQNGNKLFTTQQQFQNERFSLKQISNHLKCSICLGYLIDAVTLDDCMDTFCKSCIIKHFESLRRQKISDECAAIFECPKCKRKLDEPMESIRDDVTMRSIVYKTVPGLYHREMIQRRKFYRSFTNCATTSANGNENLSKTCKGELYGYQTQPKQYYKPDDMISVCLIHDRLDGSQYEEGEEKITRYLNCPSSVTVADLKRLVSCKFTLNDCPEECIRILHHGEIIDDLQFSLSEIIYTCDWMGKSPIPISFQILSNSKSPTNSSSRRVTFSSDLDISCIFSSNEYEEENDSETTSEDDETTDTNHTNYVNSISNQVRYRTGNLTHENSYPKRDSKNFKKNQAREIEETRTHRSNIIHKRPIKIARRELPELVDKSSRNNFDRTTGTCLRTTRTSSPVMSGSGPNISDSTTIPGTSSDKKPVNKADKLQASRDSPLSSQNDSPREISITSEISGSAPKADIPDTNEASNNQYLRTTQNSRSSPIPSLSRANDSPSTPMKSFDSNSIDLSSDSSSISNSNSSSNFSLTYSNSSHSKNSHSPLIKSSTNDQSNVSNTKTAISKPKRRQQFHGWSFHGLPEERRVHLGNEESAQLRICYPAIQHVEGDIIKVKDCVLLKSGLSKEDLPYVAKIVALWEDPSEGDIMMSLFWYYRPEHIEEGRLAHHLSNELFASKHKDVNSVACIEDKCYVLTLSEYYRFQKRIKMLQAGIRTSLTDYTMSRPINYPRAAMLPSDEINPELVFMCRQVYDSKHKKLKSD